MTLQDKITFLLVQKLTIIETAIVRKIQQLINEGKPIGPMNKSIVDRYYDRYTT